MSVNERRSEQTCESSMASTSTRTTLSISSSSSTRSPKYEVFLSFRGEDTRHGFTSHLHDALKRLGIVVFRDEEKLEKGEEIYPYLKEAIEGSQYAVVIISERFAESKSCLFELSAIMECKRKGRITVFPVFYHVEPSNVRNQSGKFGEYFAQLKEDPKVDAAEWEIWKAVLNQVGDCRVDSSKVNKDPLESCGVVLKEVGDISGWHVQNRDESKIIKEISKKIFAGWMRNSRNIDKSLVGIDSQVKEIMELLHLHSSGVHYIRIWGMGGIGKTTLAKVIFAKAALKFEAKCFIHGIGEKKDHLIEFKKQLVSAILSKDVIDSLIIEYNVDEVLMYKLTHKKVLIVLDDIRNKKELDALAKAEWFGEGSRIIITSRSHDWPCLYKGNIYEVKILNDNVALQLFCSKAFPKCRHEEKLQGLIKKIVNLAKGLPLALEIFGSYLSNKKENDWQGYLSRLKAHLDPDVKGSLKITFDGLEGYVQDAFLDIVCFFSDDWSRLEKDCLCERLEWLGYPSNILTDLESKALIKFAKNEEMFKNRNLFIHDLLLQMGEELADQKGLWRPNDLVSILQGNAGKTEIDRLKILQTKYYHLERCDLEVFSKMKNLRILEILCYQSPGYQKYSKFKLSNEIRYMHWTFYPFESFPAGFEPTNLTEVILESSKYFKRLSDGNQYFWNLKRLSLKEMIAMEETPNLSQAPRLETLHIVSCRNVSSVHPSIGLLKQLKTLSFVGCTNLERFSGRLIPRSLETLHFLKCPKLKNISDEISSKSLKVLKFEGCSELKSLPDNISTKRLEVCSLYDRLKLKISPDTFSETTFLRHLEITESSMEKFPSPLRKLPNLEELFLINFHMGELLFDIKFSRKAKFLIVSFRDTDLRFPPLLISSMKRQILYSLILLDGVEFGDLGGYDGHKKLSEALFSSLKSLLKVSLVNCGLESISIPKSVSHWSISVLDLSKNIFMELPDSMCELSNLQKLILNDCTFLQALPKLPLSLHSLELRNCLLLKAFHTLITIRRLTLMASMSKVNVPNTNIGNSIVTSDSRGEMFRSSICYSTIAYVGFVCKPHKILYLNPSHKYWLHALVAQVACGPMAKARIPEAKLSKWSIHTSTNSNKRIQFPIGDGQGELAVAMLIFYKVHKCYTRKKRKRNLDQFENLNIGADEGNNRILPEFICELQFHDIKEPFVFYVPKVTHFGSHGVWKFQHGCPLQ